jgi:hypothetical protein
MAKEKLSPLGLIMKKLSVLFMAKFASKQEMEALEQKLQMQVEGLPYVGFDYDFADGDLIMDYVGGTEIIEGNFNFADGDLIISTTQ